MGLRLLGAVEVWSGPAELAAGPPQQCLVLAVLAADAGRLLPVDVLVDRIWGAEPPPRARRTLQTHITRIRRVLEQLGPEGDGGARVVRRTGGYVLAIDLDEVDVHRFRRLVAGAHDPACAEGQRLVLLREAVALWRGEPLAGLAGDWAARTRQAWQQQRVDGVVAWAQAELRAGDPTAVLAPVSDLAGDYPLVEPLTAVLMRALSAAGRMADAVEMYADIRSRLADELGADPGPELQAAHRAVLRGECKPPARPAPRPAAAVRQLPAQLPAEVPAFTGRRAELAELDALVTGGGRAETATGAGSAAPVPAPTAVVVSAVSGMPGVGKTALTLHWAHRVRDRFPDGQLYVNLRGYDPDRPVSAADALAGFLRGLGVASHEIPLDEAERAARYRTELAGRRMLIVLDNARSGEHVRPLLPGTASAVAVVTSRDSLAGLVAVDGARRLDLDLLPAEDAAALLRRLIGGRIDAEPAAAAMLADRCARLPLALRVAAELAATRPTVPLAGLVAELGDVRRRLRLLDAGGDPRAAVTAVFSWSLQHLPADAACAFRLLGLHPGPDFDAHAAAALTATGLDRAGSALESLAQAHLLQPAGGGRYGMHDLLRSYAADLAGAEDAAADPRAADRLFDYYLAAAAAAMDLLHPAEAARRPRIAPVATPSPPLTDPDTARAWLDAERATLVAVVAHTAGHGRPAHAVRLAATLFRYLDGGHYTDALAVHERARDAARSCADPAGEADALIGLGSAHMRLGGYEQVAQYFHEAGGLYQQAGDHAGQARALNNLGLVEQRLGHNRSAADRYLHALALYRQVGNGGGEANALANLGFVEARLGHHSSAADHQRQALALYRQAGDQRGEARVLNNLGTVEVHLGRPGAALSHQRQALALYRGLGNRDGQAWALAGLGDVHTRLGEPERAVEDHHAALLLFRETGDRDGQAWALNGLGDAARAAAQPADARSHHAAALAVAVAAGAVDQQARAHAGLGHAHRAVGDGVRAREHYQRALTLYTDLGSPAAGAVREALAALDPRADGPN